MKASSKFLFPEGNSINRPFIFNGQGYHYWKTCMQLFIEAIDLNISEAIEIGPFIPTMIVRNETIENLEDNGMKMKEEGFNIILKLRI